MLAETARFWADICLCIVALGSLALVGAEFLGIFSKLNFEEEDQ